MGKEKAWVVDFQEKFKDERYADLLTHLKKFSVAEEFSLDNCYINVMILIDFMNVIEKNKEQLKNPWSLEAIKRNVNPSPILGDYIVLEISSFYSKINDMIERGKKFSEPPKYGGILKDYRNLMPGHRDKDHELKTLADYTSSIKKLDSIRVC